MLDSLLDYSMITLASMFSQPQRFTLGNRTVKAKRKKCWIFSPKEPTEPFQGAATQIQKTTDEDDTLYSKSFRSSMTYSHQPSSYTDVNIPKLPREIIDLILSHFINDVDYESIRIDETGKMMPIYSVPLSPLKTASLVSHSWRHAVLPFLFTHVQLFLHENTPVYPALQPVLAFLTANNLGPCVKSFAIFIDHPRGILSHRREVVADAWRTLLGTTKPLTLVVTLTPLTLPYFLGRIEDLNLLDQFDENGNLVPPPGALGVTELNALGNGNYVLSCIVRIGRPRSRWLSAVGSLW